MDPESKACSAKLVSNPNVVLALGLFLLKPGHICIKAHTHIEDGNKTLLFCEQDLIFKRHH